MRRIVIDTDILINLVKGYAGWLENALKDNTIQIILPTIVVAEYLGAPSLEKKAEYKIAEKTFSYFAKQDFTEDIARIMGKVTRKAHYPQGAGTADLMIASTAIYLDAPLATGNKKHFEGIPSLRFFDPKSVKG